MHTAKVLEALIDKLLQDKNLTHYWTYPRFPKMNAHNERFNRTIQEQFVHYNDDLFFNDINLFNQKMAYWLIRYNTEIPHYSLQMKTSVEYIIKSYPKCQMLWTDTLD